MTTQNTTKTMAVAKPIGMPDYPVDRVSTMPNARLEHTSEVRPANAQDFATAMTWLRATGARIIQANPSRIVYSLS